MEKYDYGTAENREYLRKQRDTLLSFGRGFASLGGSAYYLGEDGRPIILRPRETWITARMAHVYCLGEKLGVSGSKALAEAAIRGLLGELHDEKNGGWYAGITAKGTPIPEKQCYTHAFVILAACSGVLTGCRNADRLLEEALRVFDQYFWDDDTGLATDQWDASFSTLSDYRGLNANMHTVEALLAAADATGKTRIAVGPEGS